jgi:hypothetical protein
LEQGVGLLFQRFGYRDEFQQVYPTFQQFDLVDERWWFAKAAR